MVLLAVMHMFYQYFAGRYKLRYEILWVTGIILGVVTIIEAYTGYDLIFNIRGQLAINIGQTLTYYTPVLGANLAQIIFGFSFNDLTIRFYAFHVFIIPIIMLAIMSVHLPKNLVLDIPVASAITGIILILGGLFPVEVGVRYDPNQLTQITFPEWYFTSLYAFIRVQRLAPFIAGAIIPGIFVLIFTLVPFFDRGRKIAMTDSYLHLMGIPSQQFVPAVSRGGTVAYRSSIIRWFLTYRNGTRIWFRVRIREVEEGQARRLAGRQETNTVQEGQAILIVQRRSLLSSGRFGTLASVS